ncbi:hypothetical protein D3C77_387460 [compost metagenome]
MGGAAMGSAGGMAATSGCIFILGIASSGLGALMCGVVGGAVGGWAGGRAGQYRGEMIGEYLYGEYIQ